MFVYSDGDPSMPGSSEVRSLKAAGIVVSTIAVAPHGGADPGGMKNLAQSTGGSYHLVSHAQTRGLPELIARQIKTIQRTFVNQVEFIPTIHTVAGGLDVRGIGDMPPLTGYVRTTPKRTKQRTAFVAMTGPESDPIVASMQEGLGRTVAVMTDSGGTWSSNWRPQPMQNLWHRVAEWASPKTEWGDYPVEFSVDGEIGRISINAVEPDGSYANGLTWSSATVIQPDGTTQEVPIRQVAPGRYEGTFPVEKPGLYAMRASYLEAGRGAVAVESAAARSYSREYGIARPDLRLLERIAQQGSGKLITSSDSLFADRGAPISSLAPLSFPLLVLAASLFIFDVLYRRMPFTLRDLGHAMAWPVTAPIRAVRELRRGREDRLEQEKTLEALADARRAAREEAVTEIANEPAAAAPKPQSAPAPESTRPAAPSLMSSVDTAPDPTDKPAQRATSQPTAAPTGIPGAPKTAAEELADKKRRQREDRDWYKR
jgi:hypothetical protein